MAEIKVSQLPEATQINDNDLLMIVQGGTNKKITKENCQFASGDEVSIGTTEPTGEEKLWIKTDETTNQARYKDGNTWDELSIKALDSMEIGTIVAFAGTTIPNGWLECNGATITQTDYPELYALVGGTLPNLKGRVIVGQDTSDTDFDTLGETGGEKTHTLTQGEIPNHTHYINSYGADGSAGTGWVARAVNNYVQGNMIQSSGVVGGTGGAHNNLQPYAVYKWIIKAKQTTPVMASVVNTTNSSTTDAYSCNYINNAIQDVYSTTETKTNKVWIDGKPIYRKVVELSNVGTGYIQHNHGITNVDKLITMVGILDDGSGNIRYLPNVACDNMALYGASLVDFKKSGTFNTLFGTSIRTANVVVAIFEYTKTTD